MLSKTIMEHAAYIKKAIRENKEKKYLTYGKAIGNLIKNRHLKYEIFNLKEAKRFKTSDTIFVLGAGPSLNRLQGQHLAEISRHDSFGINYTFLKDGLVPTFQQISYEKDWGLPFMVNAIAQRKEILKNTIFFLSDKALFRLGHPRITPEFFPIQPKCCYYKLPKAIILEEDRSFSDNDFKNTLFYRGTLTLVLDLVLKLDYKKIVLLGIDPDKVSYFFEGYPEMKEYCDILYGIYQDKGMTTYENMVPKNRKYRTIDEYLFALNKYLSNRREVRLYTGFSGTLLSPRLPAYFE